MWTLVLMAYDTRGIAAATIPGFSSYDTCSKAGLEMINKRIDNDNRLFERFECVEVK
jgi:hypothetical protein